MCAKTIGREKFTAVINIKTIPVKNIRVLTMLLISIKKFK